MGILGSRRLCTAPRYFSHSGLVFSTAPKARKASRELRSAVRSSSGLLRIHAADRALHEVSHQRNLETVKAQRHRAFDGHASSHLGGFFVDRLAGHRLFHLRQAPGVCGYAIHRDADAVDLAAADDLRGRNVDEREIPHGPVANFFKVEFGIRPLGRNANRGEQFAWPQDRHARDVVARTDKILFRVDDALATCAENHHLRLKCDHRRSGIRRADSHTTVRAENRVLAVDRGRRIGIAEIAAGTVAVKAASVIPAARILRYVPANGALVPDLWGGSRFCGFAQDLEFCLHAGMIYDIGKRGHGADFQTAIHVPDSDQFLDLAQIDHHFRTFDAILEPIETVEATRQYPRIRAMLV